MSIVVNATPLVSLSILGQLDLLPRIFGRVYLPCAVYDEVITRGRGKAGHEALIAVDWFQTADVLNVDLKSSIMLQLDEGEAEVITIAKDKRIPLVCIDEFAGRPYAKLIGLDVIGTLGVLLIAKQRGYIALLKPLFDTLIAHDRHIGHVLYRQILQKAGE